MKKAILIPLLSISFLSYSQKVLVGLNGGILAPSKAQKAGLLVPEVGYKAGFEVIIKLYEGLNLRTGIDYSSFDFSQDFKVTDQNGTFTRNVTVDAKVNYVGIPIGLRYVFIDKVISPFVDVSVSTMAKVSDKYSSSSSAFAYAKNSSTIISPSGGVGILFNPGKKIYATFLVSYIGQLQPVYQSPVKAYYNSIGGIFSLGYKF